MEIPPKDKKWFKKQEEALRNAEGEILVKWGNFHFTTFFAQDELVEFIEETPPEQRQYYEVLTEGNPQRMFADLDGEGLTISDIDVLVVWSKLMQQVFKDVNLTYDTKKVRILKSKGKKISYHWSYLKSFRNSDEQKLFWKYVEHIIERDYTELCFLRTRSDNKMELMNVLDISVYSKNRAFRTYHSTKAGSDRVLEPVKFKDGKIKKITNFEPLEYLVLDTESTKFLDLNIPQYEKVKNKFLTQEDITKLINTHVPNVEVSEVSGRMFKLKNNGNRMCIINGEENISDNSYVIWRRDGLYFGCHDSGCEGQLKQIVKFDTTFRDEKKSDEHEITLLKSEFTDGDVSDYVIALYGDDIRVDYDDIYLWKEHYWLKSDESLLDYLLDTKLYKKLKGILDTKFDKSEDFKKYLSLLKKINNFRNCKPRSNYIKAIINTLKNTQPKGEFDHNPNLICFENGVYDLESNQFRDGKKEDLCSQVVPYDWEPSTPSQIDNLMKWIDQIMPLQDEKDCLLRCLSSCLTGRLLENIIILTGKGRNGKDTLITGLLHETLGPDLYYNCSTSVITQATKGGISQEKANMHKKRAVIYSEPSKDEVLRCANLKEVSGCPELTGRALYSKRTSIINNSTSIIHTNAIPNLDHVDDAIFNRLVIFQFRALFRTQEKYDEYPEGTEYLYLTNTYYKSQEFLETNRLVFMNILIKYYEQFQRDKYLIVNIPKTMQDLTKGYLCESDDFVNWFNTEYQITPRGEDYIKMKDVYALYRSSDLYQNLNKKEKRRNNKDSLIKEIQNNPNLKPYYRDRIEINGKTLRSVIIKHTIKEPDSDDDDDNNDEAEFPSF
jgi:phage/plasmid-associated DNA primase